MALMRQILFWAFLVALLSLCQLLNAADLRREHRPQGDLKVRLDYDLAKKSKKRLERAHRWVFSSHLKFNGNVADITDGQLRKIAEDAYQEMVENFMLYSPEMDEEIEGKPVMIPAVITILAFGNEIILSSSQKGKSGFINDVTDSPVKDKLQLCMSTWADFGGNPKKPDHKNGRGCGEIMTLHQYYQIHTEKISHLVPKARATTVHKNWRDGTIRIIPPCGTQDDYRVSSNEDFTHPPVQDARVCANTNPRVDSMGV